MASTITEGTQLLQNSGFNTKYLMQPSHVRELKTLLCDSSFINNLKLLFANPSDFINSIKMYPFNVTTEYPSTDFFTLESGQIILGKNVETGIYSSKVTAIKRSVLLGSFTLTPQYNNFLDYEPYTKVDLYVPYFAFISLPVNDLMGKTIYLYLAVDFDTGIGTLYIQSEGRVVMTTSTKLGLDIPMGASNMNQIVKDNFLSGVKGAVGLVGLAVGGGIAKLGGGALALSSAFEIANNGVVRYNRGSLTGGYDMLASPTTIYAIITRPNALTIDSNYNRLKGKPLGETRTLSTLTGFTMVSDVHLSNIPNALDDEIKEIETLLRNGVEL